MLTHAAMKSPHILNSNLFDFPARRHRFKSMPHLFRTPDGAEWKPSHPVPLTLADSTKVEGIWAGSAQEEKLRWWLGKPGHELAQTAEVSAIAVKGEKTKQLRWGDAPPGARIFFVLEAPTIGKSGTPYRLAKMVTTAATPGQAGYFDDERFSLFGTFNSDGTIAKIPPLPPPSDSPREGELF